MKLIQNVGFVGLGLIGGSLAKGLVELGYNVSAYDKNEKSLQLAKEYGKFNVVTDELAKFFAQGEYDLLYICLPVFSALEFFDYLGERNYKGVITDACSTKLSLCDKAKELSLRYIGGHPIAGGERFGFENSDSKIFKNAYHILTHHAFGGGSDINENSGCGAGLNNLCSSDINSQAQQINVSREHVQSLAPHISNSRLDICSFDELRWLGELRSIHERLGMRVELFSPKRHDLIFGYISHLSHVCAYSLVSVVKDGCGDDIRFVGAGFKDTTRIASSNIDMWSDIFIDNDDVMLESIDKYMAELAQFRKLIADKKHSEIRSKLDVISTIRRSLN